MVYYYILNYYFLRKYRVALPILLIVGILAPLIIIIKLRKCIIEK